MRASKKKLITNNCASGSVAVEFALILPIFLLIVFSTVEFSVALYNKALITNASREAARAGVVLRTPKLTASEIEKRATDYLTGKIISFSGTTSTTNPSAKATTTGVSGTNLSVQVTYDYSGLGLGTLLSVISKKTVKLQATTTMVNE